MQLYIQNMFSIVKTQRAYCAKYRVRKAPSDNTIRRLYQKFITTGNLCNASHPRRRPRGCDENIKAIQGQRHPSPVFLTQNNIDLKLFHYKIQFTHRISSIEKPRRVDYVNFVLTNRR